MRNYLLLIFCSLILTPVLAKTVYPGVETIYKAHEFTVSDSNTAKKIFLSLPNHSYSASMVNELLIKNHKYFYCVREPDGQFLCHLYLNFKYNGEFQNFEKDHDYGVGSLVEFTSGEVVKGISNIEISKDYMTMSFEGLMAKKIYSKLDLSHVSYKRVNETDIEIRSGRHIRCANIYTPNSQIKESHTCKIMVPLDPKNINLDINKINLGLH